MKRFVKRTLFALGALVLAGIAWFAYQVTHPPSMAPYSDRWLTPISTTTSKLRVTFLGVSTVLLDDGETAILTDGFFTRPNQRAVFTGKVAPNVEIITTSLQRMGIKRLAAVIVTHSHYDHAMDAPEVAKRTSALVVGSESTANVARGWGLTNESIRVVHDADTLSFGRFQITFIRSQHAPTFLTGGTIDEPLIPPVRTNQYKEGTSFSVLIKHDEKSLLIHSSAGFVDAALKGQHADVVFLGIGSLGVQSNSYRQNYWREVVRSVSARRVIPIHWDNFFMPLDYALQPLPSPFDHFDTSMTFLIESGQRDGVDIKLAPAWRAVDPFVGL